MAPLQGPPWGEGVTAWVGVCGVERGGRQACSLRSFIAAWVSFPFNR